MAPAKGSDFQKLSDYQVTSHAGGFATIVEINLPSSIWLHDTSSFHGPELSDFIVNSADLEEGTLALAATFRTASWSLSSRSVNLSVHAVAGSAVSTGLDDQRVNVVAGRMVSSPVDEDTLPLDNTSHTWHFALERLFTPLTSRPTPVRIWFTILLGDRLSDALTTQVTTSSHLTGAKASTAFKPGPATRPDIDPLEAYVTAPMAQDVCFRVQGRHLWANKRILASKSTLWRSMFGDAWANGYQRQLLGMTVPGEKAKVIETKAGQRQIEHGGAATPGVDASVANFAEEGLGSATMTDISNEERQRVEPATILDVTDFSYITMRALLVFVVTDTVSFKTIHHSIDMTSSRIATKPSEIDFYSGAISAHDLYEAAHFYSLASLCGLCLVHIRRSFSIANIAFEFIASTIKFPEVRDAVVQFALENFDLVEGTEAWDQVHERLQEESTREDGNVAAMAALARLGRLRAKQQRAAR